MFWNEEAECMSKEKKEELQLERLKKDLMKSDLNLKTSKL